MNAAPRLLTPVDVLRASRAIRPHLRPTPLRRSRALGSVAAYLKLECWQPTGSFKVRGALNLLSSLRPEERGRGIVTASAGGHGLGVAFAAEALATREAVTIFIPVSTPRVKVEKLRSFPVEVRREGATYEEAHAAALEHAAAVGATYAHAFDDPRTAAGQGSIGVEILEELPDVGTILVPCGGGGMISGIAAYAKAVDPSVRIVAVQPEASPSLRASIRRGEALHEYASAPTLCDAIAGGIGDIVFAHRHWIDDVVEVSEAEVGKAMVALLAEDQVVAEGSGAAGVAAVASGKVVVEGGRPVAIVVSGGNVDVQILARLLAGRA